MAVSLEHCKLTIIGYSSAVPDASTWSRARSVSGDELMCEGITYTRAPADIAQR